METLLQEVLDGYQRFEEEMRQDAHGRSSEQPVALLERTPSLEELEAISDLVDIGDSLT